MKKLMIAIFMFIIVLAGNKEVCDFTLLDYFSGEYTVYTSKANGNDCVDLGFCYMSSRPTTEDIVGESMVIEDFEIASAIKVLNAKVVKTEFLEDGTTVIYAFTNLISQKVKVSDKNVNLQIAQKDDITVIGWPLILGSF